MLAARRALLCPLGCSGPEHAVSEAAPEGRGKEPGPGVCPTQILAARPSALRPTPARLLKCLRPLPTGPQHPPDLHNKKHRGGTRGSVRSWRTVRAPPTQNQTPGGGGGEGKVEPPAHSRPGPPLHPEPPHRGPWHPPPAGPERWGQGRWGAHRSSSHRPLPPTARGWTRTATGRPGRDPQDGNTSAPCSPRNGTATARQPRIRATLDPPTPAVTSAPFTLSPQSAAHRKSPHLKGEQMCGRRTDVANKTVVTPGSPRGTGGGRGHGPGAPPARGTAPPGPQRSVLPATPHTAR